MIFEALTFVKSEIEAFAEQANSPLTVELGSIANKAGNVSGQISISLINTEEETTLKNSSPYIRNASGGIDIKNPPTFLNLYILIAANFDSSEGSYATALQNLSKVIQCFQAKRRLKFSDFPKLNLNILSRNIEEVHKLNMSLNIDLYSLSFEKVNQIWGTLGGKQVPFVCYKIRVVEEQASKKMMGGGAITTIESQFEQLQPEFRE